MGHSRMTISITIIDVYFHASWIPCTAKTSFSKRLHTLSRVLVRKERNSAFCMNCEIKFILHELGTEGLGGTDSPSVWDQGFKALGKLQYLV